MRMPLQLWNEEARALRALARRVPKGGTIVEIGLGCGESAALFLAATKGRHARVISVDSHPRREVLDRTIARGGHVIARTSRAAAQAYARTTAPIDLLFIDGGHSFHDAFNDVQAWVPLVRRGGIVALHDYDVAERGGLVHLSVEIVARGMLHARLLASPHRIGRLFIGAVPPLVRSPRLSLRACREAVRHFRREMLCAIARSPLTHPRKILEFIRVRGSRTFPLTSAQACVIFDALPEHMVAQFMAESRRPREFIRFIETLSFFRNAYGPSFFGSRSIPVPARATELSRLLAREHTRFHLLSVALQMLLSWTL